MLKAVVKLFNNYATDMDALATNVAAVCPRAFSGTGGGLFLTAVSTLIAAHCTILDNSWPTDNTEEIIGKG